MSSFEKRRLENCFASDLVYEYLLDFVPGEDLLAALQTMGELKCYRSFPRPYFSARLGNGILVKALIGDSVLKVILPSAEAAGEERELEALFEDLSRRNEGDERG